MDLLEGLSSSSSDEDEDEVNYQESQERRKNQVTRSRSDSKESNLPSRTTKRPRRSSSQTISIVSSKDLKDNDEGKAYFERSVPHQRGHWAGHICIPISSYSPATIRKSVRVFQRYLEKQGCQGIVVQHEQLHLSLCKFFSLQLGNIEPFVQQLRERLQHEVYGNTRLFVDREEGMLLVNDEQTRTFWGWKVHPNPTLLHIVRSVDVILKRYGKEPYYDPPKFHISLASFRGSVMAPCEDQKETEHFGNSDSESDDSDNCPDPCFIEVDRIVCSFGSTKTYLIPLNRSSAVSH